MVETIATVLITGVLAAAGTVFVMYLRGASSRSENINKDTRDLEKRIRDMENKVATLEHSCSGFEKQFTKGDGKFETLHAEMQKICGIVTRMDVVVQLIARKNGLDVTSETAEEKLKS